MVRLDSGRVQHRSLGLDVEFGCILMMQFAKPLTAQTARSAPSTGTSLLLAGLNVQLCSLTRVDKMSGHFFDVRKLWIDCEGRRQRNACTCTLGSISRFKGAAM